MLHPLHHLELAVVVAAVEDDLLDRHRPAAAALLARAPHDPERAVTDDFLHAIALPACDTHNRRLPTAARVRAYGPGAGGGVK